MSYIFFNLTFYLCKIDIGVQNNIKMDMTGFLSQRTIF